MSLPDDPRPGALDRPVVALGLDRRTGPSRRRAGVHPAVQRQGPRRLARRGARWTRASSTRWTPRTQGRSLATDAEDAKKHWQRRRRRDRQRRPRRLPDHRQGLRRRRAVRRLEDRPQGRRRRLPPRHPPGPDLGLHRVRANSTSAPTRARGASGTTPPARTARTRSSWPTTRSASGTRSGSSRSAPGPPSI